MDQLIFYFLFCSHFDYEIKKQNELNRPVLHHWYTSKKIHWRLKNIAIKTNHFLKLVSYEVKYTDARQQRSIKLCSHGQWIHCLNWQ